MLLAGDIGGTNTRLALFNIEGGAFVRRELKRYESRAYGSLAEIVKVFLGETETKVNRACFGIPGPVIGGRVKTTNLPWELSDEALSRELKIPGVKLVNDLVSYTASIPFLGDDGLVVLHKGSPMNEKKVACVVAPGTGLGVGFLQFIDGIPHPVASEGGHADFAPNSDLEIELLRYLRIEFPKHVSYERVLCGPGLLNIYRFLKETSFAPESAEIAERLKAGDPAAVISKAAMAEEDKLCVKALDMFCCILGSFAGSAMLMFMATSGVYLGGGIPPKIIAKLQNSELVSCYLGKGRFEKIVGGTPLAVIRDEHAALLGAASLAARS